MLSVLISGISRTSEVAIMLADLSKHTQPNNVGAHSMVAIDARLGDGPEQWHALPTYQTRHCRRTEYVVLFYNPVP